MRLQKFGFDTIELSYQANTKVSRREFFADEHENFANLLRE
jgi:hypothetical protein